jgi:phosphate transport system substrate-binding protein
MASRRIRASEVKRLSRFGDLSSSASEHTIALDGIAAVVNPRNPVNRLTREQLAAVFAGEITSWDDLGGKLGEIHLYARDDRSGTLDTFRHLVLGERQLSSKATRFEDNAKLSDAVAADPKGIGFVGLPYVRSTKPLMIGESDAVAVLPSPVSVASEDYLLTRRLYLYVPPKSSGVARDFLDFALSDDGQVVVAESGFVDLRPVCDARASHCANCSHAYRYLVRGACRMSVSLRFVPDSDVLDSRAFRDLGRLAVALSKPPHANKRVTLIAFSDEPGDNARAERTSGRLAQRAAAQLRARGFTVEVAIGLGRERLLARPSDPGASHRNRRVEIWLR